MVMEAVHKMGIKDLTICATSLGKAQTPIVPMIEDGTITNIQASGVRGKIGEAISNGKLKGLASCAVTAAVSVPSNLVKSMLTLPSLVLLVPMIWATAGLSAALTAVTAVFSAMQP